MENNFRVLEITVISGEEVYLNRKQPVKKNSFVTIKTDEYKTQTTRMDKDGGRYPAWDEKFVIDMPMHARYFTAEVRCKTNTGNKVIGTARIPASDFLGGLVPESYLHFLSYRLWDSNGERNGIINLSVRVKRSSGNNNVCSGGGGGGGGAGISCLQSQPWSGIPVGDKVSSSGIAMGIPVWS